MKFGSLCVRKTLGSDVRFEFIYEILFIYLFYLNFFSFIHRRRRL